MKFKALRRMVAISLVYSIYIYILATCCGCQLSATDPGLRLGNEWLARPELAYYGRVVYCDDVGCDQDILDRAAMDWNEEVGLEVFSPYTAGRRLRTSDIPVYTTDLNADPPPGKVTKVLALTTYTKDSCYVEVDPPASDSVAVMVHELGHCLGFLHNMEDPESIMYPLIFNKEYGVTQWVSLDMLELLDTTR